MDRFIILSILIAVTSANVLPHYVRTPHGLVWSECKYEIGNGAQIITDDKESYVIEADGVERHFEQCSMPFLRNSRQVSNQKREAPVDGWQVWTAFNNANNATFDSFLGSFNVPQAPSNFDGGILYMFTGLQNDNWVPISGEFDTPPSFDIIQPVLQYGGDSDDGGGDYWALACWYVTLDENVFFSNVTEVQPGEVIFGNMTRISPITWFIGGDISSAGISTSITVKDERLAIQNWAYVTLEVYQIDDCSTDFPPASSLMKFTGLELFADNNQITPTWDALSNSAHCGATISVLSPSAVTNTF